MTPGIESAALVALLRRGDRPWHLYADLIEETGSALAVLERDDDEHRQRSLFGGAAPDPELRLQDAADLIAGWHAAGMHLITVLDPDYPENLRGVHDRLHRRGGVPAVGEAFERRPQDLLPCGGMICVSRHELTER